MYEDFYQFSLDPFRLGPDHRLCYPHRSYNKARAYVHYALRRCEGFVMVTGEPGTGKTTLINELLAGLDPAEQVVARLATAQLGARDLLRSVAYALGLAGEGVDQATLLRDIGAYLAEQHQSGKRVLLVVDEAQDLEPGALTELRLLANAQRGSELLVQIFLVGQQSLASLVRSADMQQFHQRIIAACHLEPLSAPETRAYIEHRLKRVGWQGDPRVSEEVYPLVHGFSRGVPRRINLIMSRLLLHGWTEETHELTAHDVELTLAELRREKLAPVDGEEVYRGEPLARPSRPTLPAGAPVAPPAERAPVGPDRTRRDLHRPLPEACDDAALERGEDVGAAVAVESSAGVVSKPASEVAPALSGPAAAEGNSRRGAPPSAPDLAEPDPMSNPEKPVEAVASTIDPASPGTNKGGSISAPAPVNAPRRTRTRRGARVAAGVATAMLLAGALGYTAHRAGKLPTWLATERASAVRPETGLIPAPGYLREPEQAMVRPEVAAAPREAAGARVGMEAELGASGSDDSVGKRVSSEPAEPRAFDLATVRPEAAVPPDSPPEAVLLEGEAGERGSGESPGPGALFEPDDSHAFETATERAEARVVPQEAASAGVRTEAGVGEVASKPSFSRRADDFRPSGDQHPRWVDAGPGEGPADDADSRGSEFSATALESTPLVFLSQPEERPLPALAEQSSWSKVIDAAPISPSIPDEARIIRDELADSLRGLFPEVEYLDERTIRLRLGGERAFRAGRADLTPGLYPALAGLAQSLRAHPDAVDVRVVGHTSRSSSAVNATLAETLNLELSRGRARAVARYLVGRGIPERRIQAEGRGSRDPRLVGPDAASDHVNRRVEIVLTVNDSAAGRGGPTMEVEDNAVSRAEDGV